MGAKALKRTPWTWIIALPMTVGRDVLTKVETVLVAAIETEVPAIFDARNIIADFKGMIRRRSFADLAPWRAG